MFVDIALPGLPTVPIIHVTCLGPQRDTLMIRYSQRTLIRDRLSAREDNDIYVIARAFLHSPPRGGLSYSCRSC